MEVITIGNIKFTPTHSMVEGSTNDCVVRALTVVTGSTYQQAFDYCAQALGRKPKEGVSVYRLENEIAVNEVLGKRFKSVGDKYYRTVYDYKTNTVLGHIHRPVTTYKGKWGKIEREMTIQTFLKNNPEGSYFVLVRGHAFAVKDGVVYGNHTDAKQLRKRIHLIFQVQ